MSVQGPVQSQLTLPATYMPTAQNYIPTSPAPVDFSLFKNPLQMFMQGANQGLDLGAKIADMPNAMEKLKAAKALTQKSEWAMQHPDDPAAQAYAMGPDGSSQFQGKNAQMMPDVALRRAQERANITQTGAQTGATNAGALATTASGALTDAQRQFYAREHALPMDQVAGNVPAPANAMPAYAPLNSAGNQPNQGGGAPQANAPTTNAAAPQGNGQTPGSGNAPNTITIPQPTANPGESHFTPDAVKAWWNTNWGNTATDFQWSPAYNQGQGGWVVTHKDGGKDVVTDDLILKNKGKWMPDIPLSSQITMGAAARQGAALHAQGTALQNAPTVPAGYDPSQDTGFPDENPMQTAVSPQAAQATLQGAMPTTPSNASLRGGQAVPMPTPQGGASPAPPPGASLMPGSPASAPQGQGNNIPQPGNATVAAAQASADPNPGDFERTQIPPLPGDKPGMTRWQPKYGASYLLVGVDKMTGKEQHMLGNGQIEEAQAPSGTLRMMALQQANKLNEQLNEAYTKERGPGDPMTISRDQKTAFLNQRYVQEHPIPAQEQKTLYDMSDALAMGEKLQGQIKNLGPSQIGLIAQGVQYARDKAQGIGPLGKLVGPPDPVLNQFNNDFNTYTDMINKAVNHSRLSPAEGKYVTKMLGTPADNPGTMAQNIENVNAFLRQKFAQQVQGAVSMGKGVPEDLLKQATLAQQVQQQQDQLKAKGQAASSTTATPAATGPAQPTVILTKQQFDALPPGAHYVDKNGKPGIKP